MIIIPFNLFIKLNNITQRRQYIRHLLCARNSTLKAAMNEVIHLRMIDHKILRGSNYKEILQQNKPGEKDKVNNIKSIYFPSLRLLFLFGEQESSPTNVLFWKKGSPSPGLRKALAVAPVKLAVGCPWMLTMKAVTNIYLFFVCLELSIIST